MPQKPDKLTYQSAGVDIEAANRLTQKISVLAKATNRAGTFSDIGGFGAMFDLKAAGFHDPILVSATDGVGTKLRLAIKCGHHSEIGIDLVAMCVNDLLVQNAKPLFFLDYFACANLDIAVAEAVIAGIAEGCKMAGCALIGGETAEMPGMYQLGDYDLAGFAVGAVEREKMLGVLPEGTGFHAIALPSSGLHSNGYSLVHRVLEINSPALDAPPPFTDNSAINCAKTLGEILLTPTRIYVETLGALAQQDLLNAACHITGGGFYENLPRILPDNAKLVIDRNAIEMPAIFQWLMDEGNIAIREMYHTFNMGVGMVIFTRHPDAAMSLLEDLGEHPAILGEVTRRENSSDAQIIIRTIDDII